MKNKKRELEKETTKAMAEMISRLLSLSKKADIKDDPASFKEVQDFIKQIRDERAVFRKEQKLVQTKDLIENTKSLLVDLRSKEFKKQLLSKTTILRRIPTLSEVYSKFK